MITLVLVFFILTAMFGAYMALLHFRKRKIGTRLPGTHGVLAVTSVTALLVYALVVDAPVVVWLSLGFFMAAALVGLMLVRAYLKKRPLPSGMIIIHAMLAVLGFIYLVSFIGAMSLIE